MKIIAKPIQMILWQKEKGYPHPIKFRFQNKDQSYTIIKVDRVNEVFKQQIAGTNSLIYRCQSDIQGERKLYELKFIIAEYCWVLYKM